jgi:RNA recognition motif-containing protein
LAGSGRHKHNHRSKGYAFVEMLSIEDAKRAVSELHDKEFFGRKMLVSGAKPAVPGGGDDAGPAGRRDGWSGDSGGTGSD